MRLDELPKRPLGRNLEPPHSQNGDLDYSRRPRIETGRLRIKRDGVERHQRCCARIHGSLDPSRRSSEFCKRTAGTALMPIMR